MDDPETQSTPVPRAFSLTPRALLVIAAALIGVLVVVLTLGGRGDSEAVGAAVRISGAPTASSSARPASAGAGAVSDGPPPTASPVVVHVAGAVVKPGVRKLRAGDRVEAAITAAGGAAPGADLERVNLARLVVDGEQLYVPKVGETELPIALGPSITGGAGSGTAGAGGAGAAGAESGSAATGGAAAVDLNAADSTALETLPGIGPALAGRILAWRDEHGRFSSVEDLLDVTGIGEKKFADLQDKVRV